MTTHTSMNLFYDAPVQSLQSESDSMRMLSFIPSPCAKFDFTVVETQWNSFCGFAQYSWDTNDKPDEQTNDDILASFPPLDSLSLTIRSLEGPWTNRNSIESDPSTDEESMSTGQTPEFTGHEISANTHVSTVPFTLRERRIVSKRNSKEKVGQLEIYVPPARDEFLPESPMLVGSSDFLVWLEDTVAHLFLEAEPAKEMLASLLAATNEPSIESFETICSILRDPEIITEFTDRLATHIIHFGGAEVMGNNGPSSAWSDSTNSPSSPAHGDLSPVDVSMEEILNVIDEVMEEYSCWSATSDINLTNHNSKITSSSSNWI